MTVTLRRELRSKFLDILIATFGNLSDEERADMLADAALEVSGIAKMCLPEGSGLDWMLAGGVSSEKLAKLAEKEREEKEVADHFEQQMGVNPWPWWTDKKLGALLRFLKGKSREEIKTFCAWCRRPYSKLGPENIRRYPNQAIEMWPLAFEGEKAKTELRGRAVEDILERVRNQR